MTLTLALTLTLTLTLPLPLALALIKAAGDGGDEGDDEEEHGVPALNTEEGRALYRRKIASWQLHHKEATARGKKQKAEHYKQLLAQAGLGLGLTLGIRSGLGLGLGLTLGLRSGLGLGLGLVLGLAAPQHYKQLLAQAGVAQP